MRDHYDFTGGIRGKYAGRYAEGTNVVILDPDVAAMFPDRESVNAALRALGRGRAGHVRGRSKPRKANAPVHARDGHGQRTKA